MTPRALAQTHASAFGPKKAWSEADFATLMGEPAVIFTGNSDSFVLGRVTLDEAEILTLATAQMHQRKGLAAKALAEFASKAAKAGATSIFLEVAQDNDAARALYSAAGFKQVAERKGYYRRRDAPAVNALILRCDLT